MAQEPRAEDRVRDKFQRHRERGAIIRHSEVEEQPRVSARYRCNICRLELVMDPILLKLTVVSLDDERPRKPKALKPA
jgi:hypothetical protein